MAMFLRFLFYLFAILTCLSYLTEICDARGGGGGRGSRTSGSSRRTPTQNDHPGGNHGLPASSSSPGSSRGGRINTGGHHGSSSSSSSPSPQYIAFIILLSLSPLFIFWLIAAVFCCCKAWYNPKEKLALANEKKEQEKSGILTCCNAQGKSAPVKMYSAVQTELDRGPTKVTTQSASTESLPLSDETGMGTVDGQKK